MKVSEKEIMKILEDFEERIAQLEKGAFNLRVQIASEAGRVK